MARAMDVADEIITLAQEKNNPVSNLKLQKIMYFLNALSLIERNKPLIDDQKFEKWDYGPVIHSVYTEYSAHGRSSIESPEKHILFERTNNDMLKRYIVSFQENNLNEEDINFIRNNILKFLYFKPFELVNYSHEEPQWRNKTIYEYDDKKTKEYYSIKSNRFW